MLVLNRKENERIVIDDEIIVTLLRIQGKNARIGIEAPKCVPIHRQEVQEALKHEETPEKCSRVGSSEH